MNQNLLLIPAFNEEAAITHTLESIENIPGIDILIIDDGSSDETVHKVNLFRKTSRQSIKIISLPYNLGVGAAMQTGFLYARNNDYQKAIQFDADGQHSANYILPLLEELDKSSSDIVIGERFGFEPGGMRAVAFKMLSIILSKICRTPLHDITSGFRSANRRAIDQYCKEYPAEYLGDTIESLVLASKAGLKVKGIPAEMFERYAGEPSHNSLKSVVYLVRALLALAFAITKK